MNGAENTLCSEGRQDFQSGQFAPLHTECAWFNLDPLSNYKSYEANVQKPDSYFAFHRRFGCA